MINYDLLSENEKRKLIANGLKLEAKIQQLNKTIEDFKKYDLERKEYYSGIMKEDKKMRELLSKIEGTPYNDALKAQYKRQMQSLNDRLKSQKKTINELLAKLNNYEANKT